MDSTTLNQTLSTIHTFEDYERKKSHVEEDLARATILKHQLPEASLTRKGIWGLTKIYSNAVLCICQF